MIAAKDARQASELRDLQLQAAKSEQKQKEINQNAFDMAFMASREAETGKVDTTALSAAYFDQGGRDPDDLKIIESMQKMKGPNIDVMDIGGFTVVTQDGRYMTASRNGEAPSPAALQTLDGQLAQLKRARELYNEGDEVGANDILAILDLYKDILGNPKPASEVFGPLKPKDPSDDSSSLDDVDLSDTKPFDPDAYLAEKGQTVAFDPDAYLAEKTLVERSNVVIDIPMLMLHATRTTEHGSMM